LLSDHQKDLFDEIRKRWSGDIDKLTIVRAALDIGILSSILMTLDHQDNAERNFNKPAPRPIEAAPVPVITASTAAPCRRGQLTRDPKTGKEFQHEVPQHVGYCIWCGAGAPPPRQDPNANLLANGGKDRVWCGEHVTFHEFDVDSTGKIVNAPDCEMFDNAKKVSEP